jgi:hypothetical protein
MRTTARRIGDGQALKQAMRDAGMTLEQVAAKTRALDPAGTGVSRSMIGFLTAPRTPGTSGTGPNRARRFRDTTSPATADLIEQAVNARPGALFSRVEVPEAGDPVAG